MLKQAIEQNLKKDQIGPEKFDKFPTRQFVKVRIYWPVKSITGAWIFPFQKAWRFEYGENVWTDKSRYPNILTVSLYYSFFHLYLTDEEYIMAKLEI